MTLPNPRSEQHTIRLPAQLSARIKLAAKRLDGGVSVNEFVVRALERMLEKVEF